MGNEKKQLQNTSLHMLYATRILSYVYQDDDHFLLLPAFIHIEAGTQDVIVTSHNDGKTLRVTNNNHRLLFINVSQANFYNTM